MINENLPTEDEYRLAAEEIIRIACYKSWMTDEEYESIKNEAMKSIGRTKEDVINEVKLAVKQGESIESQLKKSRAYMRDREARSYFMDLLSQRGLSF